MLPTQPAPLPPELTVAPARTHGILAARALPLRVRCDLPCTRLGLRHARARAAARAAPRAVATCALRSLAAGRDARCCARRCQRARRRRLRRALHGRRGLLAAVRVTATASASAPTVVTRRYTVTA